MAAAGASTLDEESQCLACYGPLTDPRILCCGHSFCLACLQKIASRHATGDVACSSCQKVTTIKSGTTLADLLMPDMVYQGKSRGVRPGGRMVCNTHGLKCGCKEKSKASHYCHDCRNMFCIRCLDKHMNIVLFREHNLEDISHVKWCKNHRDQVATVFCHGCGMVICNSCVIRGHESHNIEQIRSAAEEQKQKMDLLDSQIYQRKKEIVHAKQHLNFVREVFDSKMKQINLAGNVLQRIQKEVDNYISALHIYVKCEEANFEKYKSDLECSCSDLENSLRTIVPKMHSNKLALSELGDERHSFLTPQPTKKELPLISDKLHQLLADLFNSVAVLSLGPPHTTAFHNIGRHRLQSGNQLESLAMGARESLSLISKNDRGTMTEAHTASINRFNTCSTQTLNIDTPDEASSSPEMLPENIRPDASLKDRKENAGEPSRLAESKQNAEKESRVAGQLQEKSRELPKRVLPTPTYQSEPDTAISKTSADGQINIVSKDPQHVKTSVSEAQVDEGPDKINKQGPLRPPNATMDRHELVADSTIETEARDKGEAGKRERILKKEHPKESQAGNLETYTGKLGSGRSSSSAIDPLYGEETRARPTTAGFTYSTPYGQNIHIFKGDITQVKVDAVVNASNEKLIHLSGVSRAILTAAGEELQEECSRYIKKHGKLSETHVFTSEGYRMPCKRIIHLCGPLRYITEYWFCASFKNCLEEADKKGMTSIAIPAVGCGSGGVLPSVVAGAMHRAVKDYLAKIQHGSTLKDILLIDVSAELVRCINKCFENEVIPRNGRPMFSLSTPASFENFILYKDPAVPFVSGNLGIHQEKSEYCPDRSMPIPNKRDQDSKIGSSSSFDPQHVSASSSTLPKTPGHTYRTKYGQNIHIFRGNITRLKVDAVVNASNEDLVHGGGVAGAIREAAGMALQEECDDYIRKERRLDTSKVYTSKAYGMPCRSIIHVAGPVWDNFSERDSRFKLHKSFFNCLKEADDLRMASLAIPAVGAGIYGAPPQIVAVDLHAAVKDYIERKQHRCRLKDILLVDISPDIVKYLTELFQEDIKYSYGIELAAVDPSFEAFIIVDETLTTGADRKNGLRSIEKPYRSSRDNQQHSSKVQKYESNGRDPRSTVYNKATKESAGAAGEDICVICLETTKERITLQCKHAFCKTCIETWYEDKPTCPTCGKIYGTLKGNQPDGTMKTRVDPFIKLSGHETSNGGIVIDYFLPSGTQTANHPHPGQPYKGIYRTAYLPDNTEGNEILRLLKEAFDRRLIFTVGKSTTTGKEDQITWNDIHHKTSMFGGPERFGYPDPTYLSRVRAELAAKGIK